MKIGSTPELSASASSAAAAASQKSAQTQGAVAVAKQSANQSVRSSGVAVTVSTLARALDGKDSSTAEIDTNKVEAVRTAIQEGTYVVNPEAIADKLLSNAQEMLNRTTR